MPDTWISPEDARAAVRSGDGSGVRIAVLDSGIDAAHPDLAGLALSDDLSIVAEGGYLSVREGDGGDVFGHGTAVAGILHALAPGAEVGSFRVLGAFKEARSAVIRAGAQLALDRGYHILNCSFGCPGRADFVMSFKGWIDAAYTRGTHVVAACNNQDYSIAEWPAHFPTVISVSRAPDAAPDALHFRGGDLVEFGSRGEQEAAAWLGGARKSVIGSSFAAPRVTALLARLLSANPGLPPLLAKSALRAVAETWPGAAAG